MNKQEVYDVIIIGGSYAGLSAAMALGRSLRKVLVIDSGQPCNRQTPHPHNFITHDGKAPQVIAQEAKDQLRYYPAINFVDDLAVEGKQAEEGFEIIIASGEIFTAKKLLLATGVKDVFPPIDGFAECWGISVLHCPYCHGYEVKGEKIGLMGNGDAGFDLSRLLSNWSEKLTLLTNGNAVLSKDQTEKLRQHDIGIDEREVRSIEHEKGAIKAVAFADGSREPFSALFARIPFEQHSGIPAAMGCEFTEQGLIKVDELKRTSVPGVFAAGDNTSFLRAVSAAVAAGTIAGAAINRELIEESF